MLQTIFIHTEPKTQTTAIARYSMINDHHIDWDLGTSCEVTSMVNVLIDVCENAKDARRLIESELRELYAIGDE